MNLFRTALAGLVGVAAVIATTVPAQASTVPVGTVNVTSVASPFDSTNKTYSANCPTGTHIVGGGGQTAGGTGHVIFTEMRPISTASGDSYRVTAVEDQVGEAGTWSLLVYAYCASGTLPGYQIVTNTSPVGSGAFQNTVSTCTAGRHALGSGGVVNGGGNQVDLQTLGEGGSFPNASTGAALEDSDGFAGNWSVTAFTVCVTPTSLFDVTMVKAQSASDTTATKTVTASCPSGMRATGGAGWSDVPAHVTSITPNSSTPFSVKVVARNTSTLTFSWSTIATVFCAL